MTAESKRDPREQLPQHLLSGAMLWMEESVKTPN